MPAVIRTDALNFVRARPSVARMNLLALAVALFLSQAPEWPKADCVTTNGAAACGYDCKTTSGHAACARTPFGKCVTNNGRIFCNDPREDVLRVVTEPPQMTCATAGGSGACGYDCQTTNGSAACAGHSLGPVHHHQRQGVLRRPQSSSSAPGRSGAGDLRHALRRRCLRVRLQDQQWSRPLRQLSLGSLRGRGRSNSML